MYKNLRRKTLHQNFLWNRQLVKRLVRLSSLGKNDLVYEIGSGQGIITSELASQVWKVISVELDPELAKRVKSELKGLTNVEIINQDFLKFDIYSKRYKIFANPPFTISGEIIKKLLHSNNPPLECYLVLQKEFANKIMGVPYECLVSLQYKPWFEMEVVYRFDQRDFTPRATVDCVLVHIRKRENPLLELKQKSKFIQFLNARGSFRNQNWIKLVDQFKKVTI